MLDVIVTLAQLRMQAGNAEQALGFALLVPDHPSSTYEAKERAGRICAEASVQLTASQALAARRWAERHPLETVSSGFVD
jgi:hypothetical protein